MDAGFKDAWKETIPSIRGTTCCQLPKLDNPMSRRVLNVNLRRMHRQNNLWPANSFIQSWVLNGDEWVALMYAPNKIDYS